MNPEERRRYLELLGRAVAQRRYLLRIADVIGVAVGFRERGGETTDEPALTVFVIEGRKSRDRDDFPPHQRIPTRLRLDVDGRRVWLPVDLVESETGRLCAGLGSGASVGNVGSPRNSGTIGWIARLASPPHDLVLCTAFHVALRFQGSALIGHGLDKSYTFDGSSYEWVVSPSIEYGGTVGSHTIGFVEGGRRNNYVDVGLIRPADPSAWVAEARGIGELGPARFLEPVDLESTLWVRVSVGAPVEGGGATIRSGRVTRLKAHFPFAYPDRLLTLYDLIETDIPTVAGDSGSLLVDAERRPLGMLVGRAEDRSYFVHIQRVIEEFGLRDP